MSPRLLKRMAANAALRYGYPPDWFVLQMAGESSWDTRAVSSEGAQGVAQIMPANSAAAGIDPFDPAQALDWAARTMAGYYRTHLTQGHPPDRARAMAESDYNCGVTASRKAGGVCQNRETRDYVARR